ncbi:major facilitator superfamily transporter [Fusarium albosuccineum]|uniref:Major facilitator superfamily transporter n=1 Tax=Fusarium albosuccineum TaxID=1237068 RepID=A0A8H4LJT3_9HYPO|nr:major facilitator superfamily transporter [Fusarium albosuccineum]
MISQWYMTNEVALHMSIYNMVQPAGAMQRCSVYKSRRPSWSGWMEGICTIFVAILSYFLLPGYPERPNHLAGWYLRPKDYDVAVGRTQRIGRKPQWGLTIRTFLRAFTFRQLWVIAIDWPIGGNTAPSNYFNLHLKSLKNSDGSVKEHLHMAGCYLNYIGDVSMILLCSWGSDNLQDESKIRTVLFASGTIVHYTLSAFLSMATYPASEAPNWRIGAKVDMGFAVLSIFMFISIHFGFRREAKKKELVKNQNGKPSRNLVDRKDA